MISKAIVRAYQNKAIRHWDMLYFAVDLHDTIIESHSEYEIKTFKYAIDVLIELSKFSDITLILFTSTFLVDLREFFEYCEQFNIKFKYINENPECENTATADFSKKFYYNVIFDDKAGFDPNEWVTVLETVKICQKMEDCKMRKDCVNSLLNCANSIICSSCTQYGFFSS